jgi:hypothetical protein
MKAACMMACVVALAAGGAQAAPAHAKWMGEASCAAWPQKEAYDDFDKALLLNWVLGWLSRSGRERLDREAAPRQDLRRGGRPVAGTPAKT